MFKILINYLYALICLAASIATLVLFKSSIITDQPKQIIIGFLFLGVFALLFFFESLFLKLKWGRARKYGMILDLINDGFSEINNIDFDKATIKEIIPCFYNLCDNISRAYSIITGTNCAITIKILEWENSNIKATTFCRDKHSRKDRKNETDKIQHWLNENTAFKYIFNNIDSRDGRYFFSNNLPLMYDYQNTSFKLHTHKPYHGGCLLIRDLIRIWKWPLPYKSTIVVPICPIAIEEMRNFIGFLCVDSPMPYAFKVDYDTTLLRGVADGIYNPLKKMQVLKQ